MSSKRGTYAIIGCDPKRGGRRALLKGERISGAGHWKAISMGTPAEDAWCNMISAYLLKLPDSQQVTLSDLVNNVPRPAGCTRKASSVVTEAVNKQFGIRLFHVQQGPHGDPYISLAPGSSRRHPVPFKLPY